MADEIRMHGKFWGSTIFQEFDFLICFRKQMRLTICGFRCYQEEKVIEFPDSGVLLLKGASGSGKSTLLTAIAWILYGGVQHVYPHLNPNAKCYGILEFPGLTIRRQKRPELLTVIHSSGRLEDAVAQSYIDSRFGPKNVWFATSYIPQGSKSLLISASQADKMSLLMDLSFSTENPDAILDRIDQELTTTKIRFETDKNTLERECQEFTTLQSRYQLPESVRMTPEKKEQTQIRLQSLIEEKPRMQQRVNAYFAQKGQRDLLASQLQQLPTLPDLPDRTPIEAQLIQTRQELQTLHQAELSRRWLELTEKRRLISPNLDAELQEMEAALQNLRRYQKWQILNQRLQELSIQQFPPNLDNLLKTKQSELSVWQQFQRLQSDLPMGGREMTDVEVLEIQSQCEAWNRQQQLGIPPEQIPVVLAELERRAAFSSQVPMAKEIQSLAAFASFSTNVSEIQEKILRMEMSLDVHRCPKCQTSLRLVNGALGVANSSPCSIEKINQAKQELQQRTKALRYQQLTTQLPNWSEIVAIQPLTPPELFRLQHLRSWKPVPTPTMTLEELQRHRKYTSIQNQIKLLGPIPQTNPGPIVEELQKQLRAQQMWEMQFNQVSQELKQIGNPTPTTDIESELIQKIEHLQQQRQQRQQLDYAIQQMSPPTTIVMSGVSKTLPELESEIKRLETELKEIDQLRIQKETLELRRQDLLRQLDGFQLDDSLPAQLNDMTTEIEILTKALTDADIYEQLVQRYLKLQEMQQHVQNCWNRLGTLIALKETAQEVECATLQETVDSMNLVFEDVGNSIFDDPITIKLNLFKNLKTKDRVKPSVNFNILYKGGEYDNVNQLSGGEQDRVSVAVSIGLSRMSSSPILILDETIATLDAGAKDNVIKTLRHLIGVNKLVILVSHDVVEGIFDHIEAL